MTPDHDVVIVGDGPAGAALSSACADLGLDAVVVGPGHRWPNTYGVWLDEQPDLPAGAIAASRDHVVVVARTRRRIRRAYGTIDNSVLRAHLGLDGRLVRDRTVGLAEHRTGVEVELAGGGSLTGRVVVEASGSGAVARPPPAWQTAYGVVVGADVVHRAFTDEAVTFMDWSVDRSAAGAVPTFCYAVPVADGWLVEETVLAGRDVADARVLRSALARRLGDDVVADAEAAGRVEHVTIPMGVPLRRGSGRVVPFGAAAGMIHPVTGYSLAASLRAAPGLAHAVASGVDVHDAVWPPGVRRTRAMHDHGLAVLLRLGPAAVSDLFEAFFALPVERWAPYLRIDSDPRAVARAMAAVFRAVPMSVRRQLVRVDPRLVLRLLRP